MLGVAIAFFATVLGTSPFVAPSVSGLVHYMDEHEGFFVAGFTALLFVATVLLWRATNRAIQTAEKTTLTIESAYVFAGIGGSGPILDLNTGRFVLSPKTNRPVVALSVSAVNHGRTAGLVSTIEWGVCLESKLPPISSELKYRKKVTVGWTMPPAGARAAQELRYAVMQVLTIKRAHVFYGRITFTDLVGKRRGISEFMHVFTPSGSVRVVERRDAYARTYFLD